MHGFDTSFIMNKAGILELFGSTILDTVNVRRSLLYLIYVITNWIRFAPKVSLENHHRAVDDAEATAIHLI